MGKGLIITNVTIIGKVVQKLASGIDVDGCASCAVRNAQWICADAGYMRCLAQALVINITVLNGPTNGFRSDVAVAVGQGVRIVKYHSNLERGGDHTTMATFAKSTFNASVYSSFRPTYPRSLFHDIFEYHGSSIHSRQDLALDLGCGTGERCVF